METKKPLDSVGRLGGSSNYTVINEAARRKVTMKPYSERIPTAIANAERMLDGGEYMLIPPHIGGNETKLTLVLTREEVALAKQLWVHYSDGLYDSDLDYFLPKEAPALITLTEKIERLNHD